MESIGYLIGVAGLGCYLGMPILVKSQMPATAAAPLQAVAQQLTDSFQTTGGALFGAGLPAGGGGTGRGTGLCTTGRSDRAHSRQLGPGRDRRGTGQGPALPDAQVLGTAYCRGSLRMTCPRFVEGVSCWKRRSGCYCDQDLQTRLLSQMAAEARVQVAEEMEATRARAQVSRARDGARKKQQAFRESGAACRECPLYLDHQKFKYRALSWVSYPLAAVLIAIFSNQIRYGYHWVETSLGGWLAALQVLPQGVDSQFQKIPLISAENAMIVMLGVLVAAIILQATELVIFKFKW